MIRRLRHSLARRDQRLSEANDIADDALIAIQDLDDDNADLRTEFDHYKLTSQAEVQQWMDRCRQLETAMAGQARSFEDKTSRLFAEIERRENRHRHVAAARKSRIADLERNLDDTRSELEDARSAARASQEQVASLTETLDFAVVEHRFHVQHCSKEYTSRDRQLRDVTDQRDSLVESLDFATTEHRMHMEYCQRDQAESTALMQDLAIQVSEERTARADLQKEHDGLDFRLSMVSRAYAAEEARRKEACGRLADEQRRRRLVPKSVSDLVGAAAPTHLIEDAGQQAVQARARSAASVPVSAA